MVDSGAEPTPIRTIAAKRRTIPKDCHGREDGDENLARLRLGPPRSVVELVA